MKRQTNLEETKSEEKSNSERLKALTYMQMQRLRLKFNEQLCIYAEGEIPEKEMVERLMRDHVKADESKLPRISSPDWEYNTSSVFVQFQTPLVSRQFVFIHS